MKRLLIISVISTLICGVIFTGCDSDKINPEPQDPNEEVPVDAEQPASGLYVTGVASVSTSSVKAAAETVFTGDDIVSFNVSDGEIIFAGNRMEAIMAGVERHSELYFYIDGKPVFDPAIRIHPGYGETFEDFDLQFRTASPDIHDGVKVHLTDVYMNIDTLPEAERLIKQQEMETNKAKRKKELDVLISYLDASGKIIDVKTDDPVGEEPGGTDLTGIRIKDNPCETLRYIRKIGADFDSALDSLRIIKIILSGTTGTPLEVIFDADDRQFYGIEFGGGKYTDVLDTKGNWYERTYKECPEEDVVEGEEIPFAEYTFAGTSCQWKNLKQDEVMIVNSNGALKNYVVCTEGSYPEIDFEKHTLLLAKGGTTSGIREIKKQVRQISESEYYLYVDIECYMTASPDIWTVSVTVPKISRNAVAKLSKNIHPKTFGL